MSTPAETFDPYRDWLGIQPHEWPLDHYRLLGVARFEGDLRRIAAAADERMALVRSFQVGPRGRFTQKLLNELSTAKVCLLSPAAKAAYDSTLRRVGVSPVPAYATRPLAAPPVQPPPPPEPRVTIADNGEPVDPAEIGRPAPWWRPIATMLLAALAFLAGATVWGIIQARRPQFRDREPSAPATTQALPQQPPQPEPEPPTPEPVVQLQEGNGEVNFAPATAVLSGGIELQTIGTDELLAGFGSPDAAARWQFRMVLPGFFQLELTYATAPGAAGATLEAAVAGQVKSCSLRETGGVNDFVTDTFTVAIPKAGEHTLVLRPTQQPAGDWLVLRSVRLIPVGGNAPPVLTP